MKQADKGARVGNFIIDSIALILIFLLLTSIIYLVYPDILDKYSPASDILYFTIFFGYYFSLELVFGRTLGKVLTKTIVVDRKGNKPTVFNLIFRTLMRLIPIDGLSFLFGSVGLHDLLSKTCVIKKDKVLLAK